MTIPIRLLLICASSASALLAQQNLTVTGAQCNTSQQAVDSITTSGACTVNGGVSVKWEAGGTIHLLPGFHATAGTGSQPTFDAVITSQAVAPALTSPASGASGPALSPQRFILTFTDILGAADIDAFQVSFGGTGAAAGICSLTYSGGVLGLWDNPASQLLQTPPIQNSQCSIGDYHVNYAGTVLTFTVDVTFLTAFQGNHEVYALGVSSSGDYHPWVDVGNWTVGAPTIQTRVYSSAGTYTWTAPANVTSVQVECWGPGGSGANTAYFPPYGGFKAGGGGGGGAYARKSAVAVTAGQSYAITVGSGGSTTKTTFGSTLVVADYGVSAVPAASQYDQSQGGSGGQAANSTGDVTQSGVNGNFPPSTWGGYGGAGANGGSGGAGASSGNGFPGSSPGGGGGGASTGYTYAGGVGAPGQIVITYAGPSTATYSITGQVTVGYGLAGATIALTGTQAATVATDGNGNYGIFNLPANGNYTVSASKPGWVLGGPQTFNNLSSSQVANFAGYAGPTYTISGTVTASGAPVSGVTVFVTGSSARLITTDATGTFAFTGLPSAGTYTVTASKSGYTFNGPLTFANLSTDQTANFTSATYTISGQVTVGGSGLAGVSVALTGAQTGATTTNGYGYYAFNNLLSGTYTVSASKSGYTLSAAQNFSNIVASQTGNFTATAVSSYTISGQVTQPNGAVMQSATLSLTGAQTQTITAAPNGAYSVSLPADQYTLTPTWRARPGPQWYDLRSQPGDRTGQNYIVRPFLQAPPDPDDGGPVRTAIHVPNNGTEVSPDFWLTDKDAKATDISSCRVSPPDNMTARFNRPNPLDPDKTHFTITFTAPDAPPGGVRDIICTYKGYEIVGWPYVVIDAAPPTLKITSRPITITPSVSLPGTYTATLTSVAHPTGGSYTWSTDNPSMVGFVTPSSGPSANQVTLGIQATGAKASITLTYAGPYGGQATDSFTFALTDDTTVVAWIDKNGIPVNTPGLDSTDSFYEDLNDTIACGIRVLLMRDSGYQGVGRQNSGLLDAERIFADEFLNHNSFNNAPENPNDATYVSHQDYRIYQRLQAYYELSATGGIDPNTIVYLQKVSSNGLTPEPCTGMGSLLFSKPVEDHPMNKTSGITSDGRLVYQMMEARLGYDGQAVNQFLNGEAGGDWHAATPWIWSVIQFDANGMSQPWLQGGNLQIFPTYFIYRNGIFSQSVPEGNLMQFIGLNSTSQYSGPVK